MTVQFRGDSGEWRLASDTSLQFGTTVTVTRRNGSTSDVIVRDFVRMLPPEEPLRFMYRFEDARRAAGAVAQERIVLIEGVNRLFALFENARRHNQAPAVRFPLINTQRGLRIEMPAHGRHAGQLVALTEQHGSAGGRGVYGSLHTDGRFVGRVGATQVELEIFNEVAQVLRSFAADPAGFSAAHGRQTGQCCYCGRGLTDARSVAVGYGPICAEHYGLPWGETGAPPAFLATGPVTADGQTMELPRGSQRQQERLADNAGRLNAFDDAVASRTGQGVVTNTYRMGIVQRRRDPIGYTLSPAARAAPPLTGIRRVRTPAQDAAATTLDETTTTVIRAVRRDPNTPLEEDDFKWPPQERA